MPLPRPQPGLVIHYEYLWRHESEVGDERGNKRRPCVIVVAVTEKSGAIETVVAPITHSEPTPPSEGVEIPAKVKKHLGLDTQRSWAIVTDLNGFIWPGIDLYPVPDTPTGTYEYGFLPPLLYEAIKARIEANGGMTTATRRTE